MVDDIQNREDATWEALRKKVDARHNRQRRHFKLMVVLLTIFSAVCILGGGMLIYYATGRSQPLTLPDSVKIRPSLIVADQPALQAEAFVLGLEGTKIEVAFSDEYDAEKLGWQDVVLEFSRGNAVCTQNVRLYRFHLEPSLTVKLGQETEVDIRDFVPDTNVEAAFVTELEEGKCGIFTVQLQCEDQKYTVECTVTEDIPPKGIGKEVTVEAGAIPEATVFVDQIQDHTAVTVTYKEQPQFILAGQQPVTLVLTDLFGNTTEVEAKANVVPAADGPQFTGLTTIYLQLGNTVSYKTGVSVTDAQDGELSFTVDTGGFDNKTAGRYTVFYSAVDSDGNQLIVPRTIVVESHTGQAVRESAQAILNQIIKPGMSHDEKIYAVFKRVWHYVWYSGSSDKSSLENAAYEGFTKWAGDCYTYYAMVRVMLDVLEIPNLEVARVGGTSNHWWNLVQFEDGKYYHVDATPHKYTNMEHFKMTQSVIEAYTQKPEIASYRPNYYVYDQTLPEYQNIEIAQ